MKQYIWLYLGEQALVHEIANEWPPRNFSQLTREQRSAKRLGAFEVTELDPGISTPYSREMMSVWFGGFALITAFLLYFVTDSGSSRRLC